MSSKEQTTWSDVLDLVARLDASGFQDAEVTLDGVQVRVSRHVLPTGHAASAEPQPSRPGTAVVDSAPGPVAVSPTPPAAPAPVAAAEDSNLLDVTAPMLGVAYLRPSPDAPAFVQVGDMVEADSTVAILEVMKLMNNVTADVSGRIVEVCVTEGAMVEYGTVLFRVEPA